MVDFGMLDSKILIKLSLSGGGGGWRKTFKMFSTMLNSPAGIQFWLQFKFHLI